MWSTVTSALSDGIKEFKAAFDEDSEDYQEEHRKGPEIMSSPEIGPRAATAIGIPTEGEGEPHLHDLLREQDSRTQERNRMQGQDEPDEYGSIAYSSEEMVRAEFPVRRSATTDQSSSWELLMQENEVRRLKQEVEALKAKNDELEARVKELTEAHHVDTGAELKEENRLLKKTMAQLIDRLADLEVHT